MHSSTPLVLLHGWGVTSEYLDPLRTEIMALNGGQSVYTFDVPGFKQKIKSPYTLDDYVQWLDQELRTHNIKECVLGGHSNGGRISMAYAAAYPDRVKALVLIESAGIKRKTTLKKLVFLFFAKIGAFIFSLPGISRFKKRAERLLYRAAREEDYSNAYPALKETFKNMTNHDSLPDLQAYSGHVMMIWGAEDRSTPISDMYEFKQVAPQSKSYVFNDANHALPKTHPKEAAKSLLSFIGSL